MISESYIFPASFAQQRLWFLHQLDKQSAVYNIAAALRLSGPLDVHALEQSLDKIVERHEALRTAFMEIDEEVAQVIHATVGPILSVIHLEDLTGDEQAAAIQSMMLEDARKPFNLAEPRLLRVTLLRSSEMEHVLVITMHHIISDGWSVAVMIRELTSLYNATVAGKRASLPPLRLQYADFSEWQREWLQGEVLERQLAYWREQLGGELPVLQLPVERTRPALPSYRGGSSAVELSAELTAQLEALSRREGVTLFMLLYAAFVALLHRYSGQPEVVTGTVIANRNRVETEALIGFFVNALALRVECRGDERFVELLQRVKDVTLEAYAHQDVPFERVVQELGVARELNRNPVFEVMFTLQNQPHLVQMEGLRVELEEIDTGTAKFDLNLALVRGAEGVTGSIQYSAELFTEERITRMVGHYQQVLAAIATNAEQRISELRLLTAAERKQLVVDFNNERADYRTDQLVPQLFEEQVRRTPDALAVVDEEQQLTYGELNERANQLGRHLRALGVGPETIVGVCPERSVEMVVAWLAVLKAGGAYLPLDLGYPAPRLAFMLSDARAAVLLTSTAVLPQLTVPAETQVLCLDQLEAQQSGENLQVEVQPENLAYVIYTSGSTGQPKGVMIEHGSLLNFVHWEKSEYQLTVADRVTQLVSVSFDGAVWELWPALCAGASLHLVPEEVRAHASQLPQWMTEAGITVSYVPTALAEQVLSESWPAGGPMRAFLTGGDQLHLYRGDLEFALVNHYGPTETTVLCTAGAVERSSRVAGELPSIGRSIANMQAYVLDQWQQVMPVGVVGELYIGGIGVGRGYLGRAELTAARFVPDGVSGRASERLYRTGDLVRYRSDGALEFVGRVDQQVKLRGFRIELGEIEAVLREHAAVRDSVVVAHRESDSGMRLVAYVTGEFAEGQTDELRKFMQEKLPEYMVPARFMVLAELPLTPNGKVDRRRLPAPERGANGAPYIGPRTATEEILARMWCEVFAVEQVSVTENFFELGGHSLLATQAVSRVRKEFDIELPVRSLFEFPTIGELAAVIDETQQKNSEMEQIEILPIIREAHRIKLSALNRQLIN